MNLISALFSFGNDTYRPKLFVKSDKQYFKIVQKIQLYLSNIKTLEADIDQYNPDGSISYGKLYIKKPNNLRLEYHNNPILIMLDNRKRLIYKDNTQFTILPQDDFPLIFLLKEINLEKDLDIKNITKLENYIAIHIKNVNFNDKRVLYNLILIFKKDFSSKVLTLEGWIIPSGNEEIQIKLRDIKINQPLNDDIFNYNNK